MPTEFIPLLKAASATDVGKLRTSNEDACFVNTEDGLFIVSDGMGGEQAGSLASKIVVEVLPSLVKKNLAALTNSSTKAFQLSLQNSIFELSQRLLDESKDQFSFKNMGATVVSVLIRNDKAHIAHMGDSRAYLFRQDQLRQLTDDHSIVGILLRNREITPDEVKNHPARGRLSRFVGIEGCVYPDVQTVDIKEGDKLILCTDGLPGMISEFQITDVLKKHSSLKIASNALVRAANDAGGNDNSTVLIVACEGFHGKNVKKGGIKWLTKV